MVFIIFATLESAALGILQDGGIDKLTAGRDAAEDHRIDESALFQHLATSTATMLLAVRPNPRPIIARMEAGPDRVNTPETTAKVVVMKARMAILPCGKRQHPPPWQHPPPQQSAQQSSSMTPRSTSMLLDIMFCVRSQRFAYKILLCKYLSKLFVQHGDDRALDSSHFALWAVGEQRLQYRSKSSRVSDTLDVRVITNAKIGYICS